MQNCSQTPRLGIHVEELFDKVISSAAPNLRSLLWFRGKLMPKVSQLTHLKVLSSEDMDIIEYEPKIFGRLNQLRYFKVELVVRSKDVNSFQKFIGGMRFLQTLDLSYGHIDCELPDCVWYVKTLRHVLLSSWLGERCFAGSPPSVDLINLQTLEGIKSRESWEASGLPKLFNMKRFVIKLCNIQRDTITTLLGTLEHLISLVVDCKDVPFDIIDMREFPFYRRLQYLGLWLNYHNKIALDVGMFPIHLTQLNLDILSQGDPIQVLEKLENLRWLRLSGKGFQQMCCSVGGFVQLESLYIVLKDLEEWEIEEGALPMLKSLSLRDCDLLRVPLGLQHLTVLQHLWWQSSKNNPDGSKISKTMENEIRSICKHVPSIDIYPVE